MIINLNSIVSFLGREVSEHSGELAQAIRDLGRHKRALKIALEEAARGHNRDTIIRNHTYAIRQLEELIKKWSR